LVPKVTKVFWDFLTSSQYLFPTLFSKSQKLGYCLKQFEIFHENIVDRYERFVNENETIETVPNSFKNLIRIEKLTKIKKQNGNIS